MRYPDDFVNKIICGDCVEVMKEIPNRCVDLTITSPPYNLGNDHHTGSRRFEVYNDNLPEQEYQENQVRVLSELFRITKDNGSLFYNHKNRIRNGLSISPYNWIGKTEWLLKQEIIWWNGGQNFDKIRFFPQTERIYWLVKTPTTELLNPISLLDIWHIFPVGSRQQHTRQFPEKLVNNILVCFNVAEIILDPYSGAGTTCTMAKQSGRFYIGIDISPDYCKIAERRLLNVIPDMFLTLKK